MNMGICVCTSKSVLPTFAIFETKTGEFWHPKMAKLSISGVKSCQFDQIWDLWTCNFLQTDFPVPVKLDNFVIFKVAKWAIFTISAELGIFAIKT